MASRKAMPTYVRRSDYNELLDHVYNRIENMLTHNIYMGGQTMTSRKAIPTCVTCGRHDASEEIQAETITEVCERLDHIEKQLGDIVELLATWESLS